MTIDKMLELLKKAFDLQDVRTSTTKEGGFFGEVVKLFVIPEANFIKVANEFPMLKNALKAGLFGRNKSKGYFYTNSAILSVRSSDKRKIGAKQFFSIMGDDKFERTTLHDALCTIVNVKKLCENFLLDPKKLKYSIRHRDGNPEDVVNFVEMDKNLFGDTEEDIKENIDYLNKRVKFERGGEYGTL
ncbi:MAG: hypothetical protein SFT90_00840 [Rickettsiales bacterium]|nr:hypothetical protein [Rickettsiales bacterium]